LSQINVQESLSTCPSKKPVPNNQNRFAPKNRFVSGHDFSRAVRNPGRGFRHCKRKCALKMCRFAYRRVSKVARCEAPVGRVEQRKSLHYLIQAERSQQGIGVARRQRAPGRAPALHTALTALHFRPRYQRSIFAAKKGTTEATMVPSTQGRDIRTGVSCPRWLRWRLNR